jgi:hypothetical protein
LARQRGSFCRQLVEGQEKLAAACNHQKRTACACESFEHSSTCLVFCGLPEKYTRLIYYIATA